MSSAARLPLAGPTATELRNVAVGRALRNCRVAAGWSLNATAGKVGVSNVFLGEVERGRRSLPARLLAPLGELFDTGAVQVALGGEPKP